MATFRVDAVGNLPAQQNAVSDAHEFAPLSNTKKFSGNVKQASAQ